jgi:germination protein M
MTKLIALIAGLVLTASLGFILAGCGVDKSANSAGNVPAASGTGSVSETTSTPTRTEAKATGETLGETEGGEARLMRYEVWFMQGEILAPIERVHDFDQRIGTTALKDLLAGPHGDEAAEGFGTAIPAGTQLLGLTIKNRIATANLSSEFETGGGSLSMFARLGQVVCTLDQFETVDGVLFELDGELVDVFSGEGIILDHPVACGDYSDIVPAITVELPHDGQKVESPVLIKGTANVFEANVTVEILDSSGGQIATKFTTATCGTGCRGNYAVTVSFHVDREQRGTIVVHDDDAAGTGTAPHSVRIPVVLLP